MAQFIINKKQQASGDYEIHNRTTGCAHLPEQENQVNLGYYPGCKEAVEAAKSKWPGKVIIGCYYCANSCHES
ncbi:hypothetical protein [Aliidiomarina quisquiliarum]|uniref:hypothetical protein n=1 Tax=Aliidiomarina quisquiliarum TaxID=2938947 RepID=UPI00208ECDD7|nr:hypothetical protein [Aliidiomarina quisquiliarum]MCO4321222.1 hypothetical protein [Aliidiomarina quisquiliarum]